MCCLFCGVCLIMIVVLLCGDLFASVVCYVLSCVARFVFFVLCSCLLFSDCILNSCHVLCVCVCI